ncbi:hypothetical protein CMV_021755 [Castanea mollissima]|uniref:DUF4283 domain-containing protein n=1 Tax=Castanea mollissima TaxID=60419 RepID=A0A8J4QJJ6_9ROSI|nr:hypothetical protein CMV_021755 [Castanea mollissima]
MAEVRLSKETKSRIRAPWSKALIVEVYGRSVGFHYLTFKINVLWKPIEKMDCVNLGRGFSLIRFSSTDDYDKVRLPKLPIEFYDTSVLKEIGKVIGPVLRIDSYTASETRGGYASLCVQIDLEKPLINSIRVGRLVQRVLSEGISSLCFCCGRIRHRQENCSYFVKQLVKEDDGQTITKANEANETKKEIQPQVWALDGGYEEKECQQSG